MKTYSNEEIAASIDHTFLKATGGKDDIERLCAEAREHAFASVCVNPCEVAHARRLLEGSDVKVCTVIGFPLGQNTLRVKAFEAADAIEQGAQELDFVMNVRLLKNDPKSAEKELRGLVAAGRSHGDGIVLKLIIECCYLTDDEKRLACRLAKEAGFDFVKTSTGFGTGGAVLSDVKLMRETVGPSMGVKAAGGIRTREDAVAMLEAGANRLGCSAGVQIVSSPAM